MKNAMVLCIGVWAAAFVSSGEALAQSAADQYKQFGTVAGLAEVCLQSQSIPQKLQQVLGAYSEQGDEQKALAEQMVQSYNEGYKASISSMKIWNVSQQAYNAKAFNCQDEADLNSIKKFESTVLAALNN